MKIQNVKNRNNNINFGSALCKDKSYKGLYLEARTGARPMCRTKDGLVCASPAEVRALKKLETKFGGEAKEVYKFIADLTENAVPMSQKKFLAWARALKK